MDTYTWYEQTEHQNIKIIPILFPIQSKLMKILFPVLNAFEKLHVHILPNAPHSTTHCICIHILDMSSLVSCQVCHVVCKDTHALIAILVSVLSCPSFPHFSLTYWDLGPSILHAFVLEIGL